MTDAAVKEVAKTGLELAWATITEMYAGNTSYIKDYAKGIIDTLSKVEYTDAKVIAATLGISLATYLYIKYKGTYEQNEVLQKELNRRRRESEYSSLARRHRRSSSDFESDRDSDNERHKRHASRKSRESDSSTPLKKNRRRGGTVRRRKSTKKR